MKRILWASSLVAFLAATPALADITPVTSASRCTTPAASCPAPMPIFFSARGTTCTTGECDNNPFGNEAFHALTYKWNFGDPGSGTWAVSGQSKNIEYGPIAAHVFDRAGAYTISLEIQSSSETISLTPFTIYVDDPDTVHAGTDTLCVANGSTPVAGSGGCPSGAAVESNNDWDDVIETALRAGRHRILFKAGDTFRVDNEASISIDGPGTIGSYGTANNGKAILDVAGCPTCKVVSPAKSPVTRDWRFVDLESLQTANPNRGVYSQAVFTHVDGGRTFEDTLFYRLKQIGGNEFVVSLRSSAYMPAAGIGIFVVDNHAASEVYILHFATRRGAVLGNILGDPSILSYEHQFRIGSPGRWEDMVLSHNEVKCCSERDTTIRGEHGDTRTASQFMVVRGNNFRWTARTYHNPYVPGVDDYPVVAIWPANTGVDQRIRDIIVENNRFESGLIGMEAKTITIRNNLFAITELPITGAGPIHIGSFHSCAIPDDWADDIMIYNNSGYSPFPNDHMITVAPGPCGAAKLPDAFDVRNNVLWDPNSDSEVYHCSGTWCANGTTSNNIDRDEMPSTPYASNAPNIDVNSDWYLTGPSASVAYGAGYPLDSLMRLDFEDKLRPGDDAAWDVGAIESDGGVTPPPPLASPLPPVLLDP